MKKSHIYYIRCSILKDQVLTSCVNSKYVKTCYWHLPTLRASCMSTSSIFSSVIFHCSFSKFWNYQVLESWKFSDKFKSFKNIVSLLTFFKKFDFSFFCSQFTLGCQVTDSIYLKLYSISLHCGCCLIILFSCLKKFKRFLTSVSDIPQIFLTDPPGDAPMPFHVLPNVLL